MFSKFQCWRCDTVTSEGKKCSTCGMAYYCSDRCRINDEFRHSSSECKDVAVRYVCHGCNKKTTEKMMMCTNCMKVWFCDQECQKKAWKHHKHECLEISRAIIELRYKISVTNTLRKILSGCSIIQWIIKIAYYFIFFIRSLIGNLYWLKKTYPQPGPGMSELYYWGNTPAIDLLNLPVNEGLEYNESLSLLLCGVGDPRNACLTVSKLAEHQGKVTFVLNDISACTLARTVLLLYLLCKGNECKAQAVTQIWYSLHLSEEDHEFVVNGLKDLLEASTLEVITHGKMKMEPDQLTKLKEVWKTWLQLSEQMHADKLDGTKNVWKFWSNLWEKQTGISHQRIAIHQTQAAREGMSKYLAEIPDKHVRSVEDWFQKGILRSERSRIHLIKENFTLLGSISGFKPFKYVLTSNSLPFTSWDYKTVSAVYPNTESLNVMYSNYISDVLRKCAARLQNGDIQLSFILSDCTEMTPYLPEGMTFDRITTSNLWDYIPLPRLLTLTKPLLNSRNQSAIIITESMNWLNDFFPKLREEKIDFDDWQQPDSVLRRKVFQDTGNKAIAESDGYNGVADYYSLTEEFTRFVRASLLSSSEYNNLKPTSLVPSVNQLAAEIGLKSRDFTCRENKVAPFRWRLNCRRVNLLNGTSLTVEWTLL